MLKTKKRLINSNVTLTETMLRVAYLSAVKNRCKKYNKIKIPSGIMNDVAKDLESPKFAKLFVKSQFASMPVEFCLEHFKRLYPPASCCFGGNCWVRYEQYLERGIDDGS